MDEKINHLTKAAEAIDAANAARPDESAAGAVYAQVAIAEATLAAAEALHGIRNELLHIRSGTQPSIRQRPTM